MAWQSLSTCACCEGCSSLAGMACARHTMRRMCDGWCKDYEPAPAYLRRALTDEEVERCRQVAARPSVRFPLLTSAEIRHLLWFHAYFGDREHQPAPSSAARDTPSTDASYPDAA